MKEEQSGNPIGTQIRRCRPGRVGLYDAANEHDACGVGMLVNIHGGKSHELVESALKVLENMRHRGAEGADNKTDDRRFAYRCMMQAHKMLKPAQPKRNMGGK